MAVLKDIWNFLGRPSLTFALLLGLVADSYAGFFLVRANPDLFGPLNRLMLFDWIATYGWYHLDETWWFFLLLILMLLLVLNTFVCTLQKVLLLLRHGRRNQDRLGYLLRFSPHLMHLGFIIILASHLTSYVVGVNDQNNVVRKGGVIPLPGSPYRLRLDEIQVKFYEGRRLDFFRGRAISQRISLTLFDQDQRPTSKVLSINHPLWYRGYSIHLKRYHPSRRGGMARAPYVNLIIRKDPGIVLFFLGTAIFTVGLLAYLWQAVRERRREVHTEQFAEVTDAAA